MRLSSVDGFRNHLFRTARNGGPVRWELEHVGRDYQRPLREHSYRPRNKPRSGILDWGRFRWPSHSVSWAHFRFGTGADECRGRITQRPGNWTVQAVSGQRNLGRYWALWCLLRRLERHSLITACG